MYKYVKRSFDTVLALMISLVISPLMLPIMLGLRLTGEGHVWYHQERVGYKNQLFRIWKFATMLLDSPNMKGGIFTLKNDPRFTPMGRFLRKTKINEVPQLINILRGEMSFVGPRPVMPVSFDKYPDEVQKVIYNVTPGITGIGSIVFRDEEELISQASEMGMDPMKLYAEEIYPYKGELERWYQEHQCLSLDMVILFCTAWVLVAPNSRLVFALYPSLPERHINLAPIV